MLTVLARSRVLPEVWPNVDLVAADGTSLPRPDGWLDDVALAIQVHSRRCHGEDDDAWDRTVAADGIFAEHGIAVVGLTPNLIRRDPDRVVQRVERVYVAALSRPRPQVIARPLGHGVVG
jgi:hypothetical protein